MSWNASGFGELIISGGSTVELIGGAEGEDPCGNGIGFIPDRNVAVGVGGSR